LVRVTVVATVIVTVVVIAAAAAIVVSPHRRRHRRRCRLPSLAWGCVDNTVRQQRVREEAGKPTWLGKWAGTLMTSTTP
jgi:hypothetical protein